MELTRAQRVAAIERELEVGKEGSDGFWPVTHGDVEVGLLVQSAPSRWRLQWRLEGGDKWREDYGQLASKSCEAAAAWAVHEIATLIAMKEEKQSAARLETPPAT